jgi:hypothetical protein
MQTSTASYDFFSENLNIFRPKIKQSAKNVTELAKYIKKLANFHQKPWAPKLSLWLRENKLGCGE